MHNMPYTLINANTLSPIIITAEHAGAAWPENIDATDLPAGWQAEHYALDRGTHDLATWLGTQIEIPIILGKYTRLLSDLNRLRDDEDVICTQTDGLQLTVNNLSESERESRLAAYYDPYHAEIRRLMESSNPPRYWVSLHSYTRQRRSDVIPRPWDAGVQYVKETPLARAALQALTEIPDKCIGDNAPYNLAQLPLCPIGVIAERYNIEAIEIEICDDQLCDKHLSSLWHQQLLNFFQRIKQDWHERPRLYCL